MIFYDLGDEVEAKTTQIGDVPEADIVTPLHQAHSTNVARIPEEEDSTYGVDALITNKPGIRIGVRTADCVPILLHDPMRCAIAAVHSGWKGTVSNIIAHAVERMHTEYGTEPRNIKAVIGPCIHLEAFEVGNELYETFLAAGYQHFCQRMKMPKAPDSQTKWHIDLPSICEHQLRSLGIESIIPSPCCTYTQHDSFYSYRHSGLTGREHRNYNSIMLKYPNKITEKK